MSGRASSGPAVATCASGRWRGSALGSAGSDGLSGWGALESVPAQEATQSSQAGRALWCSVALQRDFHLPLRSPVNTGATKFSGPLDPIWERFVLGTGITEARTGLCV